MFNQARKKKLGEKEEEKEGVLEVQFDFYLEFEDFKGKYMTT